NDVVTTAYLNLAACRLFAASRESLIGRSLMEISAPESRASIQEQLDRITPDNPSSTSIQRALESEKEVYYLWTNIGLFENGELVEYQSVGRNVTDRMALEQQLKRQTHALETTQSELRDVLDAVPAWIWYKDDKNNILRVNKAAADTLGLSVEEIEGRNTRELFGEAADIYHQDDMKVFNSGEPIRGMIEAYMPDAGEQRWIQTDKIPFSDGPDGRRILVVSTDVSEIMETEAILKSINKNLDDFASMTSHDLQAPLRKIAISAELMQMEYRDNLPEGANTYFDDIAKGVERMRRLIKSFLKFMRASPDSVELEPVNLTSLLEDIAKEEKTSLETVDGVLNLPSEEVLIRGDAALIHQVFANLINNAIKYRSTERDLRIDVDARRDKHYWVIIVRDNGSGIDPGFADQVFDLFGRAKPHAGIEGSGVGLALCRRIITLHGGTIDLIPVEGDGSAFEVRLYRARNSSNE
ncbi:MAG: ATP-binding protein, partial [Pseudomonadota bacterium]